jgi:hypothetical protein
MTDDLQLPSYSDSELFALSDTELVDLLKRDGDRVPRNVIAQCARRGEGMERICERVLVTDWDSASELEDEWDDPDAWWLPLHAIMILGLMSSRSAGLLLIEALERTAEDDALADWCAGYWPALFRNKPDDVLPKLQSASTDSDLDPYVRAHIVEVIVSFAARKGHQSLDEALGEVARITADEDEDWDLRMLAAGTLLDFPRPPHRALLMELARMQPDRGASFLPEDVEEAYAQMRDEPEWQRFEDPWAFYAPDEIAARQKRWEEEAEQLLRESREGDLFDDSTDLDDFEEGDFEFLPYVRETPKVGRNDPCPCGSGKKYKKCCLGKQSE